MISSPVPTEDTAESEQTPRAMHPGLNRSDTNTVWTILPSYHMYTSVVSRQLDTADVNIGEPPNYTDLTALRSEGSNINEAISQPDPSVPNHNTEPLVIDQSSENWQNTILANVHKLENIDMDGIKIQIFFTKEIGELGKTPEIIDSSYYEFQQGDQVNGYFLIENTTDEPIPFEMFYVLFEGNFHQNSNLIDAGGENRNLYTQKFLEMFDFSSSWHYGHIERLVTSSQGNCTVDVNLRDPLDNTKMYFESRVIEPHVIYKRFFTFQVPHKLLDSSCKHSLNSHIEIPPSLGTTKVEQQQNLKKRGELASKGGKINNTLVSITPEGKLRDFTFANCRITYSVAARIIGKRSMAPGIGMSKDQITNPKGDQFIITKEKIHPIRIIGNSKILSTSSITQNEEDVAKWYKNFISRIDDTIEIGEVLLKHMNGNNDIPLETVVSPSSNIQPIVSATRQNSTNTFKVMASEVAKCKQLYKPKTKISQKEPITKTAPKKYQIFYPMTKKSLTGRSQFLGTLVISSPKNPVHVKYIPPPGFNSNIDYNKIDDSSWKFNIPLKLEFVLPQDSKIKSNALPTIKSISTEFVSFTFKSNKNNIPLPFTHDFIIENNAVIENPPRSSVEFDSSFEKLAMKPILQRKKKLKKIAESLGNERFLIDSQLWEDIESMDLKRQHLNLLLDTNPFIDKWQLAESKETNIYKLDVDLKIDLTSAEVKGTTKNNLKSYEKFCLVPSFQTCCLARFYYVKIIITTSKHETIVMNLPVEIVN